MASEPSAISESVPGSGTGSGVGRSQPRVDTEEAVSRIVTNPAGQTPECRVIVESECHAGELRSSRCILMVVRCLGEREDVETRAGESQRDDA